MGCVCSVVGDADPSATLGPVEGFRASDDRRSQLTVRALARKAAATLAVPPVAVTLTRT